MAKRRFTNILGVRIPLSTLATVTRTTPSSFAEELGQIHAAYFDKELIAGLKSETDVFEKLACNRSIPMHQGIRRQFFQYEV